MEKEGNTNKMDYQLHDKMFHFNYLYIEKNIDT